MKIFLIILGIIIYIFIGVLCYWTSILIDYKKSKTKQSLGCWLSEFFMTILLMVLWKQENKVIFVFLRFGL